MIFPLSNWVNNNRDRLNFTPNGFSVNSDGSVGYNDNLGTNWFNPSLTENQKWAISHNQAVSEFNQNMDFSREQFEYNKDLSERQQALSEESYRSGTLNQARQLSVLGINPASVGGNISGATMSGGSGASASLPSGRNGSGSAVSGLSGVIGLLGALTSIASAGADIAGKKASIDNLNADTANKNESSGLVSANRRVSEAQAAIAEGNYAYLDSRGISDIQLNTLSAVSFTKAQADRIASSFGLRGGIGNLFGASGDMSGDSSSSVSATINGAVLFEYLFENSVDKKVTYSEFFKALGISPPKPSELPSDGKEIPKEPGALVYKDGEGWSNVSKVSPESKDALIDSLKRSGFYDRYLK